MIILGIETSTSRASAALGGAEGVLAEFQITHGRRHAEVLTPGIQHLLAAAEFDVSEIRAVAVDIGPGLFTGLRVGIATAKSFAHALGTPMFGFSSLDLLAHPFYTANRLICAVVDGRRGEVFWALYRRAPGGMQRINDYQVSAPNKMIAELQAMGEGCLAVGDGAMRYQDELKAVGNVELASVLHAYPTAGSIVDLSQRRAVHEEFVHPNEIVPLYLRGADAVPNWTQRPGGASS